MLLGIIGKVTCDLGNFIVRAAKVATYCMTHEIDIGILPEEDAPHGNGLTNGQLLEIMQNGSPSKGIPPRPVLDVAMEHSREVVSLLEHDCVGAVFGSGTVEEAFEKAGQDMLEIVRETFGSEELASNDPKTVKRKGFDSPLIETGALREAINYKVRRK